MWMVRCFGFATMTESIKCRPGRGRVERRRVEYRAVNFSRDAGYGCGVYLRVSWKMDDINNDSLRFLSSGAPFGDLLEIPWETWIMDE